MPTGQTVFVDELNSIHESLFRDILARASSFEGAWHDAMVFGTGIMKVQFDKQKQVSHLPEWI